MNVGEDVDVRVRFDGYPRPNLSWFDPHGNQLFNNSHITITHRVTLWPYVTVISNTLSIRNSTYYYNGTFTCVASNVIDAQGNLMFVNETVSILVLGKGQLPLMYLSLLPSSLFLLSLSLSLFIISLSFVLPLPFSFPSSVPSLSLSLSLSFSLSLSLFQGRPDVRLLSSSLVALISKSFRFDVRVIAYPAVSPQDLVWSFTGSDGIKRNVTCDNNNCSFSDNR